MKWFAERGLKSVESQDRLMMRPPWKKLRIEMWKKWSTIGSN